MSEGIQCRNSTALPFGVIGDFSYTLFEEKRIRRKEELEEGLETLPPFGMQQGDRWILELENRFEHFAEQELTVNENIYQLHLYKFFEEESLKFPFRERTFIFAKTNMTWLLYITNERSNKIQLKNQEVDALIILFGSAGANNNRIQMIAKAFSTLNDNFEFRHLRLSEQSQESIYRRLLTSQSRVRLKIIRGARDSKELIIIGPNHSDVIEPLRDRGFDFEEERRDGYLNINGKDVSSRITKEAGLYIRNKINMEEVIGTLMAYIIPETYLHDRVTPSSIEYYLQSFFDDEI